MIQHRGFEEHFDLFGYLENVVRLAVIAAAVAAAGPLGFAAAAAAAAAAVLLVVAPEAAAAAAAGIGWSSAPCGIAPIRDSDSKELHLPYQQI